MHMCVHVDVCLCICERMHCVYMDVCDYVCMDVHACVCPFVCVTTIKGKEVRDRNLRESKGGIHRRRWRKGREKGNDIIILISNVDRI